jgi:hypothetical protein
VGAELDSDVLDLKLMKGVFGRALRERLPRRTQSHPKQLRLLCFSLKNGYSYKTFDTALPEEPEPEPEPGRSSTKQARSLHPKAHEHRARYILY